MACGCELSLIFKDRIKVDTGEAAISRNTTRTFIKLTKEQKALKEQGRGFQKIQMNKNRSFITYIISSIDVSVALLRLMGDVLVSCRFRSDSSAPEKFILYFFFSVRNTMCGVWRVSVRTC